MPEGLRIISGKYKGRTLHPSGNLPVRPTTDFAKTGLFNILENRRSIETLDCLDLFAGTGSISFELVSRGAIHVTSVEQNKKCIRFIELTNERLNTSSLTPIQSDVIRFLKRTSGQYGLIFADPPYHLKIGDEIHHLIIERGLLQEEGLFILEHSSRDSFHHLSHFESVRKYGQVAFSFFSNLGASTQTGQP